MSQASTLLCIGIDEYQDKNIPKLSYSVADCFRIERVFKVFSIVDTTMCVTNQEATRDKILNLLESLSCSFNPIYVYYSGHAKRIDKHSYLYTYDTNLDQLHQTSLALQSLIDLLSKFNAKHITVILDACEIIKPQYHCDHLTLLYPTTELAHEDTAFMQSIFTKQLLTKFIKKYHYEPMNKVLPRYQRIRQDIAARLDHEHLVFIQGRSGVGKSHFLRELKNEEKHTFYPTFPRN